MMVTSRDPGALRGYAHLSPAGWQRQGRGHARTGTHGGCTGVRRAREEYRGPGRVWLVQYFFPHVFREENFAGMDY